MPVAKVKVILERMAEIPTEVTPKAEELAAQAKNILGYSFLADRVLQPKTLSRVLKDLEIHPFKQATVDSYKAAKLDELRPNLPKPKRRWSPRTKVIWKRVSISSYTKAIPEFALRKAVQIKQAQPNVRFFVEEVQIVRSRPLPRDFDPFLVASFGPETFYIEVWDEKKFESKLF